MKIYLYDTETGMYQGEDCSDEEFFRGGEVVIPPGATQIAPPPFGQGAVPVFDPKLNAWVIHWSRGNRG